MLATCHLRRYYFGNRVPARRGKRGRTRLQDHRLCFSLGKIFLEYMFICRMLLGELQDVKGLLLDNFRDDRCVIRSA